LLYAIHVGNEKLFAQRILSNPGPWRQSYGTDRGMQLVHCYLYIELLSSAKQSRVLCSDV